jgi:hypothetical protein
MADRASPELTTPSVDLTGRLRKALGTAARLDTRAFVVAFLLVSASGTIQILAARDPDGYDRATFLDPISDALAVVVAPAVCNVVARRSCFVAGILPAIVRIPWFITEVCVSGYRDGRLLLASVAVSLACASAVSGVVSAVRWFRTRNADREEAQNSGSGQAAVWPPPPAA